MTAKEKIIKAFFDLLTINEYSEISIALLCRVANVHRTTFYAYYDNLFELLEEARDELIMDFAKNLPKPKNDELLVKDILIPYLEFIKTHVNFYLAFYSNSKILESDKLFDDIFQNVILPKAIKDGGRDKTTILYITKFYTAGISEIINFWIQSKASIIISIRNNQNIT